MKIVMLVGNGESSRIVYNSLIRRNKIDMVIEESSVPTIVFFKRRLKKLGYLKVSGQILFLIYNKFLFFRSKKRILEIKKSYDLSDKDYPNDTFKKVVSVNSDETTEILKEISPNLIIVNGTRIISKNVLDNINATFINTHVGITPKYRGVHGAYWSLVNNDKDNCGVTVHLVDTGIDTGGVLYQDTIEVTKKDNFNTYPYLQIAKAIPLLKQTIEDFSNDVLKEKTKNTVSNLYTHPTLYQYFINRINGVK
jgi:folate-dependent phosphoribosylglycinamide formyltransferase PurN